MAIFAAIQQTIDSQKSKDLLPLHLEFLRKTIDQGKIKATGPFTDGTGGLILYVADSLEEAKQIANSDPLVKQNATKLEIREWVDTTESLKADQV